MKVKLLVTQECINEGVPKEADQCPIALAIGDALPYARGINVDGRDINFFLNDFEYILQGIECKNKVGTFTNKFDNDEPVEPFEMECDFVEVEPEPEY